MQEKASKQELYYPDEMFVDIQKFQKKLMLWGSNRVVKAWIAYRTNASLDGTNVLFYMENILYAIRKDIGYKNLGKGKLLSMSINDFVSRRQIFMSNNTKNDIEILESPIKSQRASRLSISI